MAATPSIAVLHQAQRPLPELLPVAAVAEELGYDELWIAEDCFLSGGPTAAAAVLARTERIGVGIGLLPAVVRNPAIAAMELATLANFHPGRLRVAFGHGVPEWMQQIGAQPQRRLRALRETVGSVRALLAGDEVELAGEVFELHAVALDQPPAEPPPILVGSTGPKGIGIAAEAGDGLLLAEGAGPAAVAHAGSLLGPKALVVYAWMRIAGDGEEARAALVPTVQTWVDWGIYPAQMEHAGLRKGQRVGPEEVARVAIAGDAAECAAQIAALAEAGATTVALIPAAEGTREQLERFAAEVLPRFNDQG
jgi:5,10-methylenetetrahydromethanopterin reductase